MTVGACYSAGSVADIVDCEELHDGQVLRSGVQIPPGLLSSDSEKETISLIESTCVPYFKPFVGSDWDPVAGRFTIWAALETGSTDSLVCSVVSSDGELWAGSAENFVGSYEGVELGDCFDFPTDVNDAVVLPCSAPHEAEMFVLNAPIPGITAESPYPSDDDWDLFGSEVCDVAFESFTGRSVDDPELSYYIIYPLEADWYDATLRTLSCAAASYDGTKLSESVRG